MFVNPMKEAVAAALFKDYHGEEWEEATEPARADYLQRADLVMRTIDRSEIMNLLHTLATIMDATMPLLENAAAKEEREERDKALRKVTLQRRRDAALVAIDRAFEILGIGR
jgi:hypothetical protein